ncbi:MAG: hypothetical protein RL154_1140 [Pseudomonadota bacterium]|jgi:glucokinase
MILAVDLGGTHIRWRIGNGKIYKKHTNEIEIIGFLSTILSQNAQITSVGLAFAGHTKDSILKSAPNLQIKNLEISKTIKDKFNIPLFCDNDLKCAVRAEASIRPNAKSIATLFIGTGFGGAFMDSGKIVSGSNNLAGEVGHIPFKPSNILCGCGKNNCIEIYASGSGVEKQLQAIGYTNKTLAELKNIAPEIYQNFLDALTHAVSTVVTLLNPTVVVLGGGIIESEPWLLNNIKKGVDINAFPPSAKNVQIEQSTFENAVLEGAAILGAG